MTPRIRCQQVLAAVLLVSGSACARTTPAASAGGDSAVVVSLERGPCRGFCPEYHVDVYADGMVRFVGRKNVANAGVQTRTVSAAMVKSLLDRIASSGFATADSAYMYGRPVCGPYITDLPVVTVTAQVASGMKTVQHDPGCSGAPAFLKSIEARIDSVAGTSAWVTGGGTR